MKANALYIYVVCFLKEKYEDKYKESHQNSVYYKAEPN